MRKIISGVLVFLIIITAIYVPIVEASTDLADEELLIMDGKTITKTTTLEQINKMFGEPKIQTDSAFGGVVCSYYSDDYTKYLYIETDQNGKIMSYGAIGGQFKGKRYAEGDPHENRYWSLCGEGVYDYSTRQVYGIVEYNCNLSEVAKYFETYSKNSSQYLYGLQKHTALASKVIEVKNGRNFTQTYANEDIFYINEQLKSNDSSLYSYAFDNGRENYIDMSRGGGMSFYDYLPNPIILGDMTKNSQRPSNYKYVLYDLDIDGSIKSGEYKIYFIDPNFLETKKQVELTQEEERKLALAQEQYDLYKKKWDANKDNLYEEEPVYNTLPLSAGKYKKEALEAVTHYLNVVRVGIGMGTVKLNDTIAECAQTKATLVRYMASKGMSTGHYPTKPNGVSDEFFNKAQSYMNENLYMGNIQSSISAALADIEGDPITGGHRYNLINPHYTSFGVGSVGSQGCHKLSGNAAYDGDLVAWPSNGIMPINISGDYFGNWTAAFYRHKVSDETTVTIKCLNTDKVYEITKNDTANGKTLVITRNDLVTFNDRSITYEDGDVFEITIHNVKDTSGNIIDYTYRSVLHDFNKYSQTEITDIVLDKTSVKMNVGESEKISAKYMPTDAKTEIILFKSSDENIATVRQDGMITAKNAGNATITIKCGNITKKVNVTVQNYLKGDINKDGAINMLDINYGYIKLQNGDITEEEKQRGDVTGEGIYNLLDINKMYLYLEGKISNL